MGNREHACEQLLLFAALFDTPGKTNSIVKATINVSSFNLEKPNFFSFGGLILDLFQSCQ